MPSFLPQAHNFESVAEHARMLSDAVLRGNRCAQDRSNELGTSLGEEGNLLRLFAKD